MNGSGGVPRSACQQPNPYLNSPLIPLHNVDAFKSRQPERIHAGLAALLVGMSLAWAVVWGGVAAQESLWLDELHTAWVVQPLSKATLIAEKSVEIDALAQRARAGNQLPPFFYALRLVWQTLGRTETEGAGLNVETGMRLPSLVAWLSMLAGVAWLRWPREREKGLGWEAPLMAALGWLSFDRIVLFYGTEARPYAMVAFVNGAGWVLLALWLVCPHRRFSAWCHWTMTLVVACWLHPTAILGAVSQIAFAAVFVALTSLGVQWDHLPMRNASRYTAIRGALANGSCVVLASALFGMSMLPARGMLSGVWHHRDRWAEFAANSSLTASLQLFSSLTILVPVGLGWILGIVVQRFTARNAPRQGFEGIEQGGESTNEVGFADVRRWIAGNFWLWGVATVIPWLMAWLLTATDVAPLMHRRFVIVSMVPSVLWAAAILERVRPLSIRWIAGLASVLVLMTSQGTPQRWWYGELVGTLRNENWRGAVEWVQTQSESKADSFVVWCASGLIEENGISVTSLNAFESEYFTFPLRGPYRLVCFTGSGEPGVRVDESDSNGLVNSSCEPQPLLGTVANWESAFRIARQRKARLEPQIEERGGKVEGWVFYRGSIGSLQRTIQLLNSVAKGSEQVVLLETRAFGRVSVGRVQLP